MRLARIVSKLFVNCLVCMCVSAFILTTVSVVISLNKTRILEQHKIGDMWLSVLHNVISWLCVEKEPPPPKKKPFRGIEFWKVNHLTNFFHLNYLLSHKAHGSRMYIRIHFRENRNKRIIITYLMIPIMITW